MLVRTFLSFSLEIELDGVVPWRRGTTRVRKGTFDRLVMMIITVDEQGANDDVGSR